MPTMDNSKEQPMEKRELLEEEKKNISDLILAGIQYRKDNGYSWEYIAKDERDHETFIFMTNLK